MELCIVTDIANDLCIGKRHFERLFKNNVGITPKMYSNIVRFNSVFKEMENGVNMVDIYYKYNYFDQAHFIKDFKRFTGMTPKEGYLYEGNDLTEMD